MAILLSLCCLIGSLSFSYGQSPLDRIAASNELSPVDHTGEIISFSDVGTGANELPREWVCYSNDTNNLQWLFPDGSTVAVVETGTATNDQLFSRIVNTGDTVGIALYRGPTYNSPEGEHCCVRAGTEQRRCVTFTPCPTLTPLGDFELITYSADTNIATYGCMTGYTLTITSGDEQRTCQSDNTWTGTPPNVTCTVNVMAIVSTSGSLVASENLTLICTVDVPQSLNAIITYVWEHDGDQVGADSRLDFAPLLVTNSGIYFCTATVTSAFLSMPETDQSNLLLVNIQVPPPSVTLSPPAFGVLHGQNAMLTCTIVLDSSVNVPVTVDVEWFNSSSVLIESNRATMSSSLTYTSTINRVFTTTELGVYTCTAVVTPGRMFTRPSTSVSSTAEVVLASPPSAPVIAVVAETNSLSFTWPPPDDEMVAYYELTASYVGDCPDIANFTMLMSENFVSDTLELTDLQEFSNYSLSVTAVNVAGSSETSTLVATTLSVAPTGTVQNLQATPTPTSITLQWDEVPCLTRNSLITSYTVTFGQSLTANRTTESIPGRNFTASNLIPRTMYSFRVSAFSTSGDGRSVAITSETTLSSEVMFLLGGQFYSSHSIVDPVNIGTGILDSLSCFTTVNACCQSPHTGNGTEAGLWFFPDESEIPLDALNPHYITRGASVVRLNRASLAVTTSGMYRCEVPVSGGVESVYIGLYPVGQGAPVVSNGIQFSNLSLTCVSSGGPVSSVEWTKNGVLVTTGYNFTSTLIDTATATYNNVLTASSNNDLVGTFTCTVSNGREPSDTAEIVLDRVQIYSDEPTLTVGNMATLTCVSEIDTTMIQWFDGNNALVNMTTTGRVLEYVLNPVSDDLHEATFTCRVTRTVGTAEQSITLNVIVPDGDLLSIETSASGNLAAGEGYFLSCVVNENIQGLTGKPVVVWMDSNGTTITAGDDVAEVMSSDGMSNITFNSLKLTNADTYTCVGSLQSPILSTPRTVTQEQRVAIALPTPGVSISTPPTPLIAGTPLTLTCTITLDAIIDLSVTVDIVSEISTDGDTIVNSYMATGSTAQPLTIPVLSTTYTAVSCAATVRQQPVINPLILTSSEGVDLVDLNVQVPPPPMLTVTNTGTFLAGPPLALHCTATSPIPLISPPLATWINVVESENVTVASDSPAASQSTTTVMFEPLKTSHGGLYVCVAGYSVPGANLPDINSTASTTITVQIPKPDVAITADPMMDEYTVEQMLTLICVVTFSSAVNTPLILTPTWQREEAVLNSTDQLRVTQFVTNDNQTYTSSLEFRPLTSEFIGNEILFGCEVSVLPQSNSFVIGTTANSSINITTVEVEVVPTATPNNLILLVVILPAVIILVLIFIIIAIIISRRRRDPLPKQHDGPKEAEGSVDDEYNKATATELWELN